MVHSVMRMIYNAGLAFDTPLNELAVVLAFVLSVRTFLVAPAVPNVLIPVLQLLQLLQSNCLEC